MMRHFIVGLAVLSAMLSCGSPFVNGAIVTADVDVHSSDGAYVLLAPDVHNSDWFQYVWAEVPDFAVEQDVYFWQYIHTGYPTPDDGVVEFEVLNNGPVLMACTTRWGGGGNSSGDWMDELTTRDELEAQGWTEFATGLGTRHISETEASVDYIVFSRDCVAGEVFNYRTEKYSPPTIIRSINTVPEPSSLAIFALFALCVGLCQRRALR